jgi:hypothetical protein
VLIALCLVPAFLLPRRKPSPAETEVASEAMLAH